MNRSKDDDYIDPAKLRSKNKRQLAGPMSKIDVGFGILDILFFIPRLIMRIIRIFD